MPRKSNVVIIRYPGLLDSASAKIPTVIRYDGLGNRITIGAEFDSQANTHEELLSNNLVVKTEW